MLSPNWQGWCLVVYQVGSQLAIGGSLQFVVMQKKKQQEEISYPDGKDQICPKELNVPNWQEVV